MRELGEGSAGVIDGILRAAVERGDVPGIVAIGVDVDDTIYEGAFGRRGLDEAAPAMTADTVIWYASMTKATVATGAMLLVQRGLAELDAPVAAVLQDLAAPMVLERWSDDGMPVLRPARRPITLRHLLTHTSGFAYDIWNADIGRYMAENGLATLAECRKASLLVPLTADPGERWQYGISIDWAGQFVEAVAGMSLAAFLRQELIEPLGMVDTDFGMGPAQRRRLSDLHQRDPDGSLRTVPHAISTTPEFHMGGGGLYGTPRDYTRFLQLFLRDGIGPDGRRILEPATIAQMASNNIGDLPCGVLRPVLQHLARDSDFFPGTDQKWGLSFLINPERSPHGRGAGSLSWAGLANSYYWIDRSTGVGGLITAQILPFADPTMLDLYNRFERAFYDGLGEAVDGAEAAAD